MESNKVQLLKYYIIKYYTSITSLETSHYSLFFYIFQNEIL